MARVWSKKQKCKNCGLHIEWNPFKNEWEAVPSGWTHCAASKKDVHEPKG